jgi:hypothetical protein
MSIILSKLSVKFKSHFSIVAASKPISIKMWVLKHQFYIDNEEEINV